MHQMKTDYVFLYLIPPILIVIGMTLTLSYSFWRYHRKKAIKRKMQRDYLEVYLVTKRPRIGALRCNTHETRWTDMAQSLSASDFNRMSRYYQNALSEERLYESHLDQIDEVTDDEFTLENRFDPQSDNQENVSHRERYEWTNIPKDTTYPMFPMMDRSFPPKARDNSYHGDEQMFLDMQRNNSQLEEDIVLPRNNLHPLMSKHNPSLYDIRLPILPKNTSYITFPAMHRNTLYSDHALPKKFNRSTDKTHHLPKFERDNKDFYDYLDVCRPYDQKIELDIYNASGNIEKTFQDRNSPKWDSVQSDVAEMTKSGRVNSDVDTLFWMNLNDVPQTAV